MLKYILGRLGAAVLVVIGVTIVAFLILHLIPGNPAQVLLFGSNPTPAQVHALEVRLGLERPLYVQYGVYMWHLAHGNLGTSFSSHQSVGSEIVARAPSTLLLTAAAMGVAIIVGLPLGMIGGVAPGSIRDRIARAVSFLGASLPYFWVALLLVLIFAVRLKWFPAIGTSGAGSLVLPAVALGWGYAAILTRLIRARLIEVYSADYIRTATGKGCSEWRVLTRHGLRNALIPSVTMMGLQVGNMLTGAAVIEVIFGRPGLGSYMVNAISSKDIPVVQGTVLFVGCAYVLINLTVDVLVGAIDPRVRREMVA